MNIIRAGHPTLRQVATTVSSPTSDATSDIIAKIFAAIDASGGEDKVAGLAAPQIDISQRIFIYQIPAKRALGGVDNAPKPFTVVINPEYTPTTNAKVLGWEGCISLPGLVGEIARFQTIEYKYTSPEGKIITGTADGFHARVFQHEYDHLDGKLWIDRITDPTRVGYTEEVTEYVIKPEMELARGVEPPTC